MDCSRYWASNPSGPPRPLEYLCRGCGVVECRECSIDEHTKPQCSLVRLSALGKDDIDRWCFELAEKFNKAISVGTQMEIRRKSLLEDQRKIQNRSKEICQSVSDQFAVVFDAVWQSHDKLIAQVKEVERIACEKLINSVDPKQLMEVKNDTQQLFDLSQNSTVVTREILVEFLTKKFQVDLNLNSILSQLANDESPVGNSLDEFLSTVTGRINQLVTTISSISDPIEKSIISASNPCLPESPHLLEIHPCQSPDVQLIEDSMASMDYLIDSFATAEPNQTVDNQISSPPVMISQSPNNGAQNCHQPESDRQISQLATNHRACQCRKKRRMTNRRRN